MFGTILVCFSPFITNVAVPWSVIIGEFAVICINEIIDSKNKYLKVISIIALGVCIGLYAFVDIGDMIAFRNLLVFTYIALILWLMLEKRQTIQIKTIDKIWIALYTICSLVMLFFISFSNKITTTTEYQGNGLSILFRYGYSMFLPFVNMENTVIYSGFLSLFPLSLILAMVYVYKNEKHLNFFMPMIIVIVFQTIFCISKLQIFNFIGWKTIWNTDLVVSAIELASIYLYIYMIANIKENIFTLKKSIRIVLVLLVFYFLIPRPNLFMSKGYMYTLSMVVSLIYFLFINFADRRYQKVLLVILVLWSLISSVPFIII